MVYSGSVIKQPYVNHDEESLAHRLISFYEAIKFADEQLSDPITHREFERLIQKTEDGRHRAWIPDMSTETVERDPEVAFRKTMDHIATYIYNRTIAR